MIRQVVGDCRVTLPTLEPNSVQACITSPPYYGLRDYGTEPLVWGGNAEHAHEWEHTHRLQRSGVNHDGGAGYREREDRRYIVASTICPCGAWRGSLGLEPTPDLFVEHMVEVFREVRRVLRDDGVLWLNLGDSYAGSGKGPSNDGSKQRTNAGSLITNHRNPAQFANGQAPTSWLSVPAGLKPKDLMMLPFRVAMALQQPYVVPTCVKSDVDRAWLAAMFDGEGTIGIRRHDSHRRTRNQDYQDGFIVYTTVANNDVPLLDHCAAITGLGHPRVKQSAQAGTVDKRGVLSRFDNYGWRLDGNSAVDVIRAIYPYLIAKRKQAMLAYTLDCLNKGGRELRGNGPLPAEEQAKRALLYDLIKRCNQREEVDLPTWLLEPSPKVEPGWWLRSVIPWLKRNSMPESVTDRPATAVEYVFLLSKSARYYWDADAVRVDALRQSSGNKERFVAAAGQRDRTNSHLGSSVPWENDGRGRNRRNSDWFFESWQGLLLDEQDDPLALVVNPAPFSGSHFATFPPKLVEPMVKASTRPGDTVIDCFGGAGTVGLVADRLQRNAILCELKSDYSDMSAQRITSDAPMFTEIGA
jgi:DNA modification methylase